MVMTRFHRLVDATSQWFNVLLFNGEANHSISGDAYRLGRKRLENVIDRLFFWQDHHCYVAYMADIRRAKDLLDEHAHTHNEVIK